MPLQGLIKTEITMYTCKTNATVPTPQCEEQLLGAALASIGDSPEVKKQLEAAGTTMNALLAQVPTSAPLSLHCRAL